MGRPVLSEKIFRFSFAPNQRHRSRILLHRGALAIVTNVGAGCDGRGRCERRTRLMRTAKTCGPDASTPASSSREGSFSGMTVTRKPDRRGDHVIRRNTVACGNAGCFGVSVVTNARAIYTTRAAAGALAPGIPHALPWAKRTGTARADRAAGSRIPVRFVLLAIRQGSIESCAHRCEPSGSIPASYALMVRLYHLGGINQCRFRSR